MAVESSTIVEIVKGSVQPEKVIGSPGKSAHSPEVQRSDYPKHFTYTSKENVHSKRRRQILEKYPEIARLYGNDSRSAIFCIATIVTQFAMMFWVRDMESVWGLLFLTYFVSGTLNHSLLLAMHEVTHDLVFKQRWANQVLAVIANLPMGVPAAASFKLYHAEHHSGMGEDGVDTDLPTVWEARLFKGVLGRLVWVFLQPFFYAIRPSVVRPIRITKSMLAVCALQIAFDVAVPVFLGWRSFVYLFVGTLLGTGLHPMSGHFVAEHFEFVKGQETYSYYGPLNWITYNVGHHIEHHDFPKIPGTRLPELKKIAPEFYDLPAYSSWTRVIVDFIAGRNMGIFGRIRRHPN